MLTPDGCDSAVSCIYSSCVHLFILRGFYNNLYNHKKKKKKRKERKKERKGNHLFFSFAKFQKKIHPSRIKEKKGKNQAKKSGSLREWRVRYTSPKKREKKKKEKYSSRISKKNRGEMDTNKKKGV